PLFELEARRHHEALAVLARQIGVGGPIVAEGFRTHVEVKPMTDLEHHLVERHVPRGQMSDHARQRLVGLAVVAENAIAAIERRRSAHAIADVRQMAEGAREMAFEDFALEVFTAAGADGADPVAIMIAAAVPTAQLAILVVERGGDLVAAEDDIAIGAVEDIAN